MKGIALLLFGIGFPFLTQAQPTKQKPDYTEVNQLAVRTDASDNYHGTVIYDPYRWMECDTCANTGKWVEAQRRLSESWFKQIPYRQDIVNRLTQIWSFASVSAPSQKGKMEFFYRNNGKQNHAQFVMRKSGDTAVTVLLDPNQFSKDGTTSLNGTSISKDGKYLAYSISHLGSDWNEILVKEIATGKLLSDHIHWVKFSGIAWKGNGFFYSAYDAPKTGNEYSAKNEFHKVFYHVLGTDQSADQLIFDDAKSPLRNFSLSTSEDQKYAVLSASEGTSGNSVSIADLSKWKPGMKMNFTSMVSEFRNDFEFAGAVPKGLLFLTNDSASNQRLILVDPKNPSRKSWKNILPEKEFVLESITLAGNSIVAKYLENVSSKMYQYDLNGKLIREIKLPVLGTVSGISGDMKSQVLYYAMVSYTFPSRVYKVDLKTGNSSLYFKPEIDFDSDAFETKQVWYTSKDGTKIPMFITHKKGLKIDGNNPAFLFGYGGFNISYTPEFRVDRTVFLENNGVYCVANIRGGGEFGEKWHKAGTKLQKQNVFDDFIAAAEYLVSSGYTNKNKLAIHGRSNGGLLAGACLTQRPNLFKCVIPQVGVLDMLKFHKFTIGWAWTGDYGSSENKEEFEYLKKYSPVHNVKEIAYPATLVITGDHDDRVVPAHSFKFIAELQFKQKGDAPVLVRIDSGGGHGAGKPLSMQIAEYSDMWTFVFANLEMSFSKK